MLLKKGSKGSDVKELQMYLGITADGEFGSGTEAAVKDFQRENGLAVDGIVGPNTWNAIKQAAQAQEELPESVLRKGDLHDDVTILQKYLGLKPEFGDKTEEAVKKFQTVNGLTADGIVGPNTWEALIHPTTDLSESPEPIGGPDDLTIHQNFLPVGQYMTGPTTKEYLFLHHTAGWHNPYNTISAWARDSRGAVATEFVIGGQSVKGNENKYDGEVVQAFPEGGYGWHLGKNGSQYMHTHSVGIEVCNFSYLDANNETYAGVKAVDEQIVTLAQPFKGKTRWHRYSDKQIESLKQLILYVANRDNIDIRLGLIQEIKKKGASGFEFNEDAYYGRVKGMWTHTNTRTDKSDMFPQQELLDMLLSL